MTVKSLIAELNKMDPKALVIISSDEEGNGYRAAYGITDDYNFNKKEQSIGLKALSEDDIEAGYSEEDVMTSGVPCIVIS